MKETGGSIVNVSTNCAELGVKNLVAYASSKGGIHALTRQLAVELAPYKIRVNTFAPGPTLVERNLSDDAHYDATWGRVAPLGRDFACAAGIALGGKLQKKDYRVYVMLGDGELQEGIVWETAMSAAQYQLDNLIAMVDNNRCQTDGFTAEIVNVEPLAEKWRAFGWHVQRIDGHDFRQIHEAIEAAQQRDMRPHMVIADTVKGKGVPSMENRPEWHGLPPTPQQAEAFIAELLGEVRP
jgi:transketolase